LHRQGIATISVRGLNICRDIYIGRHKRRASTAAQIAFWTLIAELHPPIKAEYFL
jgi:hypothetical protein